jgi:signal transduction histidine kinase
MPVIVTVYPLALSLLICIVAAAFDFLAYCMRHNKLIRNERPAPADQIESDYQKIIADLEDEAERSARRATEKFSDMVEYYTIWAHQIKTPIAAMRLTLQSEDTETARRLSGDLNRIEEYVEMVLTYLRLDSDDTDYLIREYDLDEIIKPAVRKFAREFILKKLSLDYAPTGYTVLTDEKWLSFVIEQIISNAVKYTSEGGVKIYMDGTGILCIRDTGIGICAEDLPRIFENGYTGFNGRGDKRASGIGLYLCKRITDNLGHGISVESVPGEGTTVRLDLRKHDLGVE